MSPMVRQVHHESKTLGLILSVSKDVAAFSGFFISLFL
jgi:hypothetical protein